MAVVVQHRNAPGLALHLAAPVDLPQGLEAGLPGGEIEAQDMCPTAQAAMAFST